MSEDTQGEFRPELLPRRGELNAWLLALAATVGMIALHFTWRIIPSWAWIFSGFLFFSALSISFGNWMDRKTRIQVEEDGIRFESGIRHVRLSWSDVQKVAVLPSRWGKTVQVIGNTVHFAFKTLGEVQFQGEIRGRTGFAEGQKILNVILKKTDLKLVEQTNDSYYYARA